MLRPLGKHILARRDKVEEKTSSGIFLESARKNEDRATVLAVGKDVTTLNVGERITFTTFAPNEVEFEEEKLILIQEEDVLAVIE